MRLFPVTLILVLLSFCYAEEITDQLSEVPKSIRERATQVAPRNIIFPVPYKRMDVVKFFELKKTKANYCELPQDLAIEFFGYAYRNPENLKAVLVPWFYLEEEKIDLKYTQAGSGQPVVYIHNKEVHVQGQNHDISKKAKRVSCPIVILIEQVPGKVSLYSRTSGW